MSRGLIELTVETKGRIAANQPQEPMEKQAADVGGGRDLSDLLDIALPAQQRCPAQRTMLRAVVVPIDPAPEAAVQFLQSEGALA